MNKQYNDDMIFPDVGISHITIPPDVPDELYVVDEDFIDKVVTYENAGELVEVHHKDIAATLLNRTINTTHGQVADIHNRMGFLKNLISGIQTELSCIVEFKTEYKDENKLEMGGWNKALRFIYILFGSLGMLASSFVVYTYLINMDNESFKNPYLVMVLATIPMIGSFLIKMTLQNSSKLILNLFSALGIIALCIWIGSISFVNQATTGDAGLAKAIVNGDTNNIDWSYLTMMSSQLVTEIVAGVMFFINAGKIDEAHRQNIAHRNPEYVHKELGLHSKQNEYNAASYLSGKLEGWIGRHVAKEQVLVNKAMAYLERKLRQLDLFE